MNLGIEGKTAIVTGASRGIGLRSAELLAQEGANVLFVARGESDLKAAAERSDGAYLACDVTDPDAPQRMLDAAGDAFGPPDILVNNAGTAIWRRIEDVPDEAWQAAWDVNVMAPMRAMRALVPGMGERGWGRVVNVSSTAGKRPSKLAAEYSVAKAAQLSLSKLYGDHYAAKGVLINAVAPGPTKSELWMGKGGLAEQSAKLLGYSTAEEAVEQNAKSRPIGRLAEVDEIASVIVFLCSERASYVAGVAWGVDGGTVPVTI